MGSLGFSVVLHLAAKTRPKEKTIPIVILLRAPLLKAN
jgi:hypothetical protein